MTMNACDRRTAATAILCGLLTIGSSGCLFAPRPRVVQAVPADVIIGAETNARANDRMRYTAFTVPTDSMLYVHDANDDILVFSGMVNTGDIVRLYPGAVTLVSAGLSEPVAPGTEPVGRILADFPAGHVVRAYYKPMSYHAAEGARPMTSPAH